MGVFILNKNKVIEQYNTLKRYADIVGYNLKANKDVGKIIERETNAPIVVSSPMSVEEVGDKKRIIYIVQGESKETLENFLNKGIKTFIIDNEKDMERLLSLEEKINLFLRMKVREHTIYTGKYFVYGMEWQKINELIPKLRKNSNIEMLGIHFHRKTQNVGEWSLIEEFKDTLSNLSMIDIINVGGGIPVEYANSKPDVNSIFEQLIEFKTFLNENKIKLALEPGRFIAAPAVKLETNVINSYDDKIILDCSVYNTSIDIILMNIKLIVEGEKDKGYKYLLKGCTPDSLDIFRYKVFFEEEKKINDKITFLNAGAYNFHTEFNNLQRIETVVV